MKRIIWEALMLLVFVIIILSRLQAALRSNSRLQDNLRISNQQAEIWRDKYGRSHGEVERLKLTNKELREAMPALIDSIKRDFKDVKPRTITNVVTVTKVVRDTIPFPVDNPLGFHYKDRWNEFKINTDSTFSFSVKDSLALVSSRKNFGFLGLKKKNTVEVVSYNPKSTITGLKSIEIVENPKRVGIGIMVGYGMSKDGLSPVVSAGVFYRIF